MFNRWLALYLFCTCRWSLSTAPDDRSHPPSIPNSLHPCAFFLRKRPFMSNHRVLSRASKRNVRNGMFCLAAVLNCLFTMVGFRLMWEIYASHGGGCVVHCSVNTCWQTRNSTCTLLLFAQFPLKLHRLFDRLLIDRSIYVSIYLSLNIYREIDRLIDMKAQFNFFQDASSGQAQPRWCASPISLFGKNTVYIYIC